MGTITWEDCVELAPFLRTVEKVQECPIIVQTEKEDHERITKAV